MIIEQKKNDIFLIKHNFFYKNEKTHFRKLLTKIFAFKHGIYNGRQFQEQFIISKRNLHTCAAIEGRCSLVVVEVEGGNNSTFFLKKSMTQGSNVHLLKFHSSPLQK